MAKSPKAEINPKVLTWARTALGYSADALAEKLKVRKEAFQAWEAGAETPSFSQLRKISDVLKRPTATFFMDHVPKDLPVPSDFRVLDEAEIPKLAPKTLLEIRKVQRKRLLALDLLEATGEEVPDFIESASLQTNVTDLAEKYRKKFGIERFEESGWTSEYHAFNVWKMAVEALGILVFQASLDSLDEMRGLAIYNKQFPIIMLNTKDSTRGKMFSLLHEFCHLLLRKSGIGNIDPNWQTKGKVNPVEVYCNEFAGQCLLPSESIHWLIGHRSLDKNKIASDASIRAFVNRFQASWEVVLRRLLEERYISQSQYKQRRSDFIEAFAKRPKKKGGNVPIELKALAYNGEAYTALVLDGYDRQKLTTGDLVDYLGVSYKHLDKIRLSLVKKGKGI